VPIENQLRLARRAHEEADGCEVDLRASAASCGSCGMSCGAGRCGHGRCLAPALAFTM
jgi:hypothetical protein